MHRNLIMILASPGISGITVVSENRAERSKEIREERGVRGLLLIAGSEGWGGNTTFPLFSQRQVGPAGTALVGESMQLMPIIGGQQWRVVGGPATCGRRPVGGRTFS